MKLTGTKREGHERLDLLLRLADKGDTIITTRIDRLARSVRELQKIVHELKQKGVALKASEQPIGATTAAGKAVPRQPSPVISHQLLRWCSASIWKSSRLAPRCRSRSARSGHRDRPAIPCRRGRPVRRVKMRLLNGQERSCALSDASGNRSASRRPYAYCLGGSVQMFQ